MTAILATDIGGTKTLVELRDGRDRVVARERYPSAAHPSIDAILDDFLAAHRPGPEPIVACLAVAGPVDDDRQGARVTNLPWRLDAASIQDRHELVRVHLINDFEAVGYSIEVLGDDDLVPLQHGKGGRPRAPRLVVGAGTGFGVGQLFWRDGAYHPQASEGGHIDFAPADERQDALLRYLRRRWSHVSVERLLSGGGLLNLFDYLREVESIPASPRFLSEIDVCDDPAAIISKHASIGDEPIAIETFRLFRSIYGAVAGSLALVTMATGGVFVAGGIAAKNATLFSSDDLLIEGFVGKGRMRPLLESMPVNIVTNQDCGLIGAARAARLLG